MPAILENLRKAIPLSLALQSFFPKCRTGKPPSLATGNRWVKHGVRRADGARIYLAATRVGREYFVTEEACADFIRMLNEGYASNQDEDRAALEKTGA